MGWVLVSLLIAVTLAILLRGPLGELRARRAARARDSRREARRARREARRRGHPERAMNRAKAAARSGPPTWQQVAARQGPKCWLCGTRTYEDDRTRTPSGERWGATYPVVDLVLPIERGGTYELDNARVAHQHCARVRSSNPARSEFGRPPRTYGA